MNCVLWLFLECCLLFYSIFQSNDHKSVFDINWKNKFNILTPCYTFSFIFVNFGIRFNYINKNIYFNQLV